MRVGRRRGRGGSGQATIEVLAGVPILVLAGLIALQILATAYTLHLADGAAEAGALAVAGGQDAEAAVRTALPGWAGDAVDVDSGGGWVRVSLRPPGPLAAVSEALEVGSRAWVRPPAGDADG